MMVCGSVSAPDTHQVAPIASRLWDWRQQLLAAAATVNQDCCCCQSAKIQLWLWRFVPSWEGRRCILAQLPCWHAQQDKTRPREARTTEKKRQNRSYKSEKESTSCKWTTSDWCNWHNQCDWWWAVLLCRLLARSPVRVALLHPMDPSQTVIRVHVSVYPSHPHCSQWESGTTASHAHQRRWCCMCEEALSLDAMMLSEDGRWTALIVSLSSLCSYQSAQMQRLPSFGSNCPTWVATV